MAGIASRRYEGVETESSRVFRRHRFAQRRVERYERVRIVDLAKVVLHVAEQFVRSG